MRLSIKQIKDLQKGYRVEEIQMGIENGSIWKFEGSVGRFAMSCLEAGICFLGEKPTYDYYGNTIPSRKDIQRGTKGSVENAQKFWAKVYDGDFDTIDALEEMFGTDVEDEVQ